MSDSTNSTNRRNCYNWLFSLIYKVRQNPLFFVIVKKVHKSRRLGGTRLSPIPSPREEVQQCPKKQIKNRRHRRWLHQDLVAADREKSSPRKRWQHLKGKKPKTLENKQRKAIYQGRRGKGKV